MKQELKYLKPFVVGLIYLYCVDSAQSQIMDDKLYFGDYEKPELLKELENYQNQKDFSWVYLGFFIAYDGHYPITPLDAIPFAGTGGNGTHFAFLTDFGITKDLSDSPIICVSPTNDPPIKLIAKNLTDFLRLVATVGDAEFLDGDYDSDLEIQEQLADLDRVDTIDYSGNPVPKEKVDYLNTLITRNIAKRKELRRILRDDFEIDRVLSVVKYISALRRDREENVKIKTIDDLGVLVENVDSINSFDYNSNGHNAVNAYLHTSNKSERLKFYRESTYFYILHKDYDIEIRRILIEWLAKDGFDRESRILARGY
jgi:hypothetical protein